MLVPFSILAHSFTLTHTDGACSWYERIIKVSDADAESALRLLLMYVCYQVMELRLSAVKEEWFTESLWQKQPVWAVKVKTILSNSLSICPCIYPSVCLSVCLYVGGCSAALNPACEVLFLASSNPSPSSSSSSSSLQKSKDRPKRRSGSVLERQRDCSTAEAGRWLQVNEGERERTGEKERETWRAGWSWVGCVGVNGTLLEQEANKLASQTEAQTWCKKSHCLVFFPQDFCVKLILAQSYTVYDFAIMPKIRK